MPLHPVWYLGYCMLYPLALAVFRMLSEILKQEEKEKFNVLKLFGHLKTEQYTNRKVKR